MNPEPLDICRSTSYGVNEVKTQLRRVGVDQLHPGPWQPRRHFSHVELSELSRSLMTAGGNVTPLIVVPRPSGGFYIISGERRWRAAQLAAIHDLLVLVGDYSDEQARFIAIIDNIQRSDLTPIEEATAYLELQKGGLSHDDIAVEVSRSRGHVSNYIRMLSLDLRVRDLIGKGTLQPSHARLLCTVDAKQLQYDLALKTVRLEWSCKALAARIAEITNKPKPKVNLESKDVDVKRLTRIVSETTGYPCVIRKTERGNWEIGFLMSNDDQFCGLLERLGIDTDE